MLALDATGELDGLANPFLVVGAPVGDLRETAHAQPIERRLVLRTDALDQLEIVGCGGGIGIGGRAGAVAQALVEEVRYDADGNPQTANLADYGLISTMELPAAELVPMETPTP